MSSGIDSGAGYFLFDRGGFSCFSYPFAFRKKKEWNFGFVADRERLRTIGGRGCEGNSPIFAQTEIWMVPCDGGRGVWKVAGTCVCQESFSPGGTGDLSTWLPADLPSPCTAGRGESDCRSKRRQCKCHPNAPRKAGETAREARIGTVPMLPTAKGQSFARSVLRETVGRWKVCWASSGALTRDWRLWAFFSFFRPVAFGSAFRIEGDSPLAAPFRCFRGEVVKKWGQAPRWMPFSRGLPDLARSQSPFFHNLGAKGDFDGG